MITQECSLILTLNRNQRHITGENFVRKISKKYIKLIKSKENNILEHYRIQYIKIYSSIGIQLPEEVRLLNINKNNGGNKGDDGIDVNGRDIRNNRRDNGRDIENDGRDNRGYDIEDDREDDIRVNMRNRRKNEYLREIMMAREYKKESFTTGAIDYLNELATHNNITDTRRNMYNSRNMSNRRKNRNKDINMRRNMNEKNMNNNNMNNNNMNNNNMNNNNMNNNNNINNNELRLDVDSD